MTSNEMSPQSSSDGKSDSNDNSPKKVRFSVQEKRSPVTKPENPAKIKVKPSDVLTHLGIIVAFVLFCFIRSFYESTPTNLQPKKKKDLLTALEDLTAAIEYARDVWEPPLPVNVENGLGCKLYLAESSIPNVGLGIYALEDFEVGEVVIDSSIAINVITGESDYIAVPQYLMNLKHHFELSNVKVGAIIPAKDSGDMESYDVQTAGPFLASKKILAGEEIFFNIADLDGKLQEIYNSLFPLVPTKETYDKTTEITSNLLQSIPVVQEKIRPAQARAMSYGTKLEPRYKKIMDPEALLNVMKNTLMEYDRPVASLLPTKRKVADRVVEVGSSSGSLKTRSELWVKSIGVCIDGVYTDTSTTGLSERGAFATRDISKGDVVITAPLFAVEYRQGITTNCFETAIVTKDTNMVLCPLSFASDIQHGAELSDVCGTDENAQCPKNVANAEYQWSEFNPANEVLNETIVRDLLNKRVTGLSIDIIASRDIQKGEEIFMDYNRDGNSLTDIRNPKLRDSMLPNSWTEQSE